MTIESKLSKLYMKGIDEMLHNQILDFISKAEPKDEDDSNDCVTSYLAGLATLLKRAHDSLGDERGNIMYDTYIKKMQNEIEILKKLKAGTYE